MSTFDDKDSTLIEQIDEACLQRAEAVWDELAADFFQKIQARMFRGEPQYTYEKFSYALNDALRETKARILVRDEMLRRLREQMMNQLLDFR